MSARERREKRQDPRPDPEQVRQYRQDRYDEAAGHLNDLGNDEIADMLGQLITHLNHRIDRTRVKLLVDDHFDAGKTNFDRHEANLDRMTRMQHEAVSLLRLINGFDHEVTLAGFIAAWVANCNPSLPPEERV